MLFAKILSVDLKILSCEVIRKNVQSLVYPFMPGEISNRAEAKYALYGNHLQFKMTYNDKIKDMGGPSQS